MGWCRKNQPYGFWQNTGQEGGRRQLPFAESGDSFTAWVIMAWLWTRRECWCGALVAGSAIG